MLNAMHWYECPQWVDIIKALYINNAQNRSKYPEREGWQQFFEPKHGFACTTLELNALAVEPSPSDVLMPPTRFKCHTSC
jgi:hypothetical protein